MTLAFWLNTASGSFIENGELWLTLAGITLFEVRTIHITLFITKLSSKVIELPIQTLFGQRRTLFKILVPLTSLCTRRNNAFSSLRLKERCIRSTRAGVIFFKEGMIDLALIYTLFKGKVVLLPYLALFRLRRAFQLIFVPLASIFTLRLNTC